MKNVLFVCEGNICRSPSAEAYFNYRVEQLGLANKYHAFSKGLIFTTNGQDIFAPFIELLDKDGVPHPKHSAKIATRNDVNEADYILVMDSSQRVLLKRNLFLKDISNISRLGDYLDPQQDIDDPYSNGKYEETYALVKKAVDGFVDYLVKIDA